MKKLFQSRWRVSLQQFLDFKRIGRPYLISEVLLHAFDRFASAHPRWPLRRTIEQWLVRSPDRKPVTVSNELTVMRQFCLYRRRFDPRTFVPEHVRRAPTARTRFRPYLLTLTEIKMLLELNERRAHPVRRARVHLLLLVLYCTGLRLGEALRLCVADVDLKAAYFRVGPSKGRSRFVPFGHDLAREIERWLSVRRSAGYRLTPQTALFEREDGMTDNVNNAGRLLRELACHAGLRPANGQRFRVHDLRHVFCVHRLQRWYRAGVNPGPKLPWLSAYLGHVNLQGTEKYLHATPELLAAASGRFLRSLNFNPAHP